MANLVSVSEVLDCQNGLWSVDEQYDDGKGTGKQFHSKDEADEYRRDRLRELPLPEVTKPIAEQSKVLGWGKGALAPDENV